MKPQIGVVSGITLAPREHGSLNTTEKKKNGAGTMSRRGLEGISLYVTSNGLFPPVPLQQKITAQRSRTIHVSQQTFEHLQRLQTEGFNFAVSLI